MGNHPCEKFPQKNYNGEGTLHSNRRRSESSLALEEEEVLLSGDMYLFLQIRLFREPNRCSVPFNSLGFNFFFEIFRTGYFNSQIIEIKIFIIKNYSLNMIDLNIISMISRS